MIGALGLAGAGVATADAPKTDPTLCSQTATATNSNSNTASLADIPDVDVDVTIAVFGDVTQTNVIQQICSTGEGSTNENAATVDSTQSSTVPDDLVSTAPKH
ncbi:hypothetical protein ACFV7Q_35445 [Streptomyces sp. NPDC059851]|uniref:hypothetical protein n=1 Tax=Streptomyces sp. NPDC059851 TaxID=3346971 RepID=UPI0036541BDD